MAQEVTIAIDEKVHPDGVRDSRTPPQESKDPANLDQAAAKPTPRTKILLAAAGLLLITAAAATGYSFFAG